MTHVLRHLNLLGRRHRHVVIAMMVITMAAQWVWIGIWLAHDNRAWITTTLLVAVAAVLSLIILFLGTSLYVVLGHVRQSEQELARMATTDLLTGVLNRRGFMTSAAQEFTRTRRHDRPLSVLAIDLDRFKVVNDEHGHAAGDAVLQSLTVAWQAVLRTTDAVGRMGGEEFAILLPETPSEQARELADRVRQAAERVRFEFLSPEDRVTVSVGVAAVRISDSSIEHALARADEALYRAKLDGRNRVQSADA